MRHCIRFYGYIKILFFILPLRTAPSSATIATSSAKLRHRIKITIMILFVTLAHGGFPYVRLRTSLTALMHTIVNEKS